METTKVLVLGAGGAIAKHVIEFLIPNKNISLTLLARNADHVKEFTSSSNIILGDVLNQDDLTAAIKESDIVYANLAGQVDKMASAIVSTMEANAKKGSFS
jgi:saccharopine dehydrogenase-like NADP-dependent oxidoreductase